MRGSRRGPLLTSPNRSNSKFRGSDRTEFVDNRQFHGNVFELLLRAERFLRENLPIAGRIVPDLFQRVDDPLYPPIARVLYRRGMIEAWGRGTVKMLELIARAGLPRPEIEDAGGCVTVRFRSGLHVPSPQVGPSITRRQQAILVLLEEGTELPLREIHRRLQAFPHELSVAIVVS